MSAASGPEPAAVGRSLAEELAPHYSRFRVAERLLLTGHSHQAWPDVAREGQIEAWDDAARDVDDKWERATLAAERVRRGYARLLGDDHGAIALGVNTHELVIRFLSALPLRERPRLVSTDGEYHSLRRQLDRLAEERPLELMRIPAEPVATLAERLAAQVDHRTAAVMVSSVLFRSAHIVPGLAHTLTACRRVGAELLIDAYHQLNVVPCSLDDDGLRGAFVVGGGYKYCQLGEGNAFLRVPPEREHYRPVITGWFSEWEAIAEPTPGTVAYGAGAWRWAGATYDPTSHYRAVRVFDFFEARGLTPERLREVSRHQVGLLAAEFDRLDLDPGRISRDRDTPLASVGGFLALRSPQAGQIRDRLAGRGVRTDHRDDVLRLGPAPYVSDDQIRAAVEHLGEVVRELQRAW
jgi:selenocysteine lyase/cysteine desulfurase